MSLDTAVMLSGGSSLVAPEVMPVRFTVCRPASSLITTFPTGLSVGESFTGRTVSVKLLVTLAAPSVTASEMMVVPNWFVTGVMVSVRLPPVPPRLRPAVATRFESDERAVTTSAPGAVSKSLTVKETDSGESSSVSSGGVDVIAGG